MGLNAIGTIAWRELVLYFRNRTRVLGTLGVPFFYLVVLGFGLNSVLTVRGSNFFTFLVPGIMGMVVLFQSVFSGLSVVTERQFGFLKEMLVAPIRRTDIVLGKAIGNALTATLQGLLVLIIAFFLGFTLTVPWYHILFAIVLMFLAAIGFVGLGLAISSRIKDPQVFQLLFNFLIMPLFLLSGAMFPIETAPGFLQAAVYVDPMGYAVDGLRYLLLGASHLPLWISVGLLVAFDAVMIVVASWLFSKSD
ncbi:MAG: ABC transporter permease [Candidatus Diapherotrites archaeon]|nr:ABC transporter permease [Candidatus Diapherotrites archaeon]